jgi:hypothetical protein
LRALDALVVEYGSNAVPRQLLIDAGTFHSWDGIRAELMRRTNDRYEVFVVTHVEEDHIGGSIALLDDPDLKQRIDHVWFNGFVHCQRGGNVLGPVNGEQLTRRIVEGGFRWNRGFTPKVSNDVGGPVVVPRRSALHRPAGRRNRGAAIADRAEVEDDGDDVGNRCQEGAPRAWRRRCGPLDEPEAA